MTFLSQRESRLFPSAAPPATESISLLNTPSGVADMFWRSNVTVRPTIRAQQRAIEIGCGNNSLKVSAGNFTVYGPRIGSCARTMK